MESSFELALTSALPGTAADVIRDRFGEIAIHQRPGRTVLEGWIADQAAVRALLGLLWDMGCEVSSLRVTIGVSGLVDP